MKILITGIDGFLGRPIAEALNDDGHVVVGLSNGEAVHGFRFYNADITDREEVFDVLKKTKPELCIHLAAMAHADVRPSDEWKVRRVNVDGAMNVADAAEKTGCKDFVYFSSAKVLAETTSPEGIDEDQVPEPIGVYPRLKREVELDLLQRNNEETMNVAIIRPVAAVGRGDLKGNYAKMIRAIDWGFFPLLEGGKAKRSIVFSDRVAIRMSMMVKHGVKNGGVYTFSDGDFTLREIVNAIKSTKGFAWCPRIPLGPLKMAAPTMDKVLALLGYPNEPMNNALKRLTSSFVIKTHRFQENYGTLPQIDLQKAFEKSVSD